MDMPDIVIITEIENALSDEESSWSILKDFNSEFNSIGNEYWIVFRKNLYKLDDFFKIWQEKFTKGEGLPFANVFLEDLKKYKNITPILKCVKGEDFLEKHWTDMFNVLKMKPKPVDELQLRDFLDNYENLLTHEKYLQDLNKKAASEIVIRQTIKDIDQWGSQCKFVLYCHIDSLGKEVQLIKEFKEIVNDIGDHQILLQSLKHSTSLDGFMEATTNWENKLEILNEHINLLAQIQKRWLYLEPIFESGTIPQEKVKFIKLDKDFRKIMSHIEHNMRVIELCNFPNLKSTSQNILDQLTRCQHSLNNFLKEKRDIFPRFLFLSDDDLLEIIGQSSKEQVIQSQLKKLFAGINSVQLNSSGTKVVALCSLQGEVVQLENSVDIKRPVEEWLGNLVNEMQFTLKQLLIRCHRENQAPDPLRYPAQILCLSNNIWFTINCEKAISSMSLPTLLAKYKTQLSELSSMELHSTTNADKELNESIVLELKHKALLLDTIHHIRILQELLNKNVSNIAHWIWQKELRYYSDSNGDITIKMAKAKIKYSYEYLGNYQQLVRTPLVERCFLTLTQAMHLGLGGNPYGPAGTGKTESVKALGSILGRQVLVFNCDEGIDANSMERILTGLLKTGAWGCFDEFNRLDETTLSAISMIIHSIQEALKNNLNVAKLANQDVPVNKHCGVFVTLNPAGDGYGGRNKLPDNLKQLFRPVIMTHPDHEDIIRTYLHCDGYQNANIISKKIVEVFDMSSKLMSKQQHYDWGLRAIKTVLSGCQTAIKEYNISSKKFNLSLNEELGLVTKALKMDILSKLTFLDTVKFSEIISNVFKDVFTENMEDEQLKRVILEMYDELNLVINDRQVKKCLEFYKQLKQRMGVAIIGPPSSGKSTIIEIVSKALMKIHQKIKIYTVNPKCMSRQLLLGYTDHLNQWNDGVLTNFSLQVAAESKDIWSWIICDGDIDPEWVESLNSVLDDNRLMTLPSGWRIHFGPNVNFVFETNDVKNASPATISRIGIVYLSSEDITLTDFLKRQLSYISDNQRSYLEPLLDDFFLTGVNWMINDGEITLNRSQIAISKTGILQLLDVKTRSHFIVALINGLGQQLKQEFRELFAKQVFDWFEETAPSSIQRLYYNQEKDLIDVHYTNPKIEIDDVKNGIPLIETGQILKYLDILKSILTEPNEEHFLFVGPHGSAKRLLVNYLFSKRSDIETVTINCSPNLQTNFIIHQIQQHCISVNTFQGTLLKPRRGYVALYFRNLHLLKPDIWGSNKTIEFLRQLIEYKGFYHQKTEFVRVQNILIIGTMLPSHKISSRFLSKLHLLNIDLPEKEDLSVITVAYLSSIIKNTFSINFPKTKIVKMALTMVTVLEKAKNMFMSLRHYCVLTPHDLIQWCTKLKYYAILETDEPELKLLEIICYEALRIFTDRLVSNDDKKKLNILIDEIFFTNWGIKQFTENVSNVYYVPMSTGQLSSEKPTFAKYLKDSWHSVVDHGIVQFGKEHQEFHIVVNDEILLLTAAIIRAAAIPEYNMLLIGKAGVGRKTAITIASALLSARVFHPSSGNSPVFQNELKSAIQHTGVEGDDVILILEDYIFSTDQNLNLINLLMTSGEVPDLFTDIEMESLVKGLKEKFENENFDGDLIQFFANNTKKKLHIFVILDQDNINIRNIFLNCPAFSQNSGLLWLDQWSDITVKIFPTRLVALLDGPETSDCSSEFGYIYKSLQESVPSRYTSMVKLYYAMYKEKNVSIKSNISKLKGGVSKLTAAKNLVDELKQKAAEQQQKLAEKQAKANAALDMISNTIKGANTHKEEMEILKRKTEGENVQLVKRKSEIEKELAEVEPLIKDASTAVENIKTESLSEIRSLRAPPEIIRDILEGVLKLMGTQDTSWNSMKTFLAKRGVKEEIRSFDASRIQTENRQAVEKLMAMKKESFDLKSAKRASVAAAPLAAWVEANVKYSRVLDKIRPLEKEQQKLKQNLVNAETQLVELKGSLLDVDTTVVRLKEQLSLYTKEAAELEIDLKQVHQTLTSAENLVSKLELEYRRWQEQCKNEKDIVLLKIMVKLSKTQDLQRSNRTVRHLVAAAYSRRDRIVKYTVSKLEDFSTELELLPNKCLLAAAIMSFLSEEPENKRRDMIKRWCSELNVEEFDFILFFSTEREQLHWEAEGLPNNKISLENAIVIKQGILSPLLIDPTSTAVNWLKEHYSKNGQNFEHINCNSSKFNTVLEASVRFGKTLLVEEIEKGFYTLLPILRAEFIYRGDRKMIHILGRKIDYHSDFKLIMCTRNEHFLLPAEVAPYITILNFNVTCSGFTEQLLSSAVTQEKPDLESKRLHLLKENEELQEKLHMLQNQLLECLVNSDKNILKDEKLLTTLNDTKTSFTAISDALTESKKVQNKLREEYEIFLNISSFGSQLYMACREFAKYNILYSLSAHSYKKLFLLCIKTIELQDGKMESSKRQLFQSVYNYMSKGMFKSDRLLFFFHLVYKTFPNDIPDKEMNIFLGSGSYQKIEKLESVDLINWLPKMAISRISYLKEYLPDLFAKCQLNEKHLWVNFMESPSCEKEFPSFCKLSQFQKLLIIQSLRPDKLLTAIEHCVLRISGLHTIDPPVLSLQHTFNESTAKEPILLITTSGMDPSTEIRELATHLKSEYEEVSMGEGQEEKALVSLKECNNNGKWLILKNIQLVTYWLTVLSQHINQSEFSQTFRLWLITTCTQNFNIVLAQNCLKIAYEEPQGIGNNMQRIYTSIGEKYENLANGNSSRIFFTFSSLHALLQERRNYIPQGWTKYYEFNHTDIQTCLTLTEDLWNTDTTRVQWEYITGLVNEAVYSGRIENVYDRRILDVYTKLYFKDEVLSHKWKPLGLNIILPTTTDNKEYINVIKQFPKRDQPSMFGLSDNIDKARGKQISQKLISGIKELYQKGTMEIANQDTQFKNLPHYISLWKKINEGLDFIKLTILKEDTGDSAIRRFIHEEYELGISLIKDIHKCFTSLKKISKGMLDVDDDNVLLTSSISQYQTPPRWLDVWNGPKDLTQFLHELLLKTNYLSTWKTEQCFMLKQPINLSLFFHPATFLASAKQDYSRSSSTSMDNLVLRTSWTSANDFEIVLSDLLIEGALFENKTITPCKTDSENINLVPYCHLYWSSQDQVNNAEYFMFPLYSDSSRKYEIANLQVEGDVLEHKQWILRGVAFYLKY